MAGFGNRQSAKMLAFTALLLAPGLSSKFLLDENGFIQIRSMPGKCISTLDKDGKNKQSIVSCKDKSAPLRWTFENGRLCSGAEPDSCLIPNKSKVGLSKAEKLVSKYEILYDDEYIKAKEIKSGTITVDI